MTKSLRDILPQLEIDWLLPAWLLIAIVGAAIAEIITIGLGVQQTYNLSIGWIVGIVIASSQAMGSMMWARASQHNAGRKILFKSIGPKDNRRSVEDKVKSEPQLNVILPLAVSVLAGVVSAWVGWYLYAGNDTPGLGAALAIASPAGSITAAMLNGTFAYGESAVATWRKDRKDAKGVRKPIASQSQASAGSGQANASSGQIARNEFALRCWCGKGVRNRNGLAAHSKKHLREVAQASDAASARQELIALYPGASVPEVAEIAAMRKKVTVKETM